MHRSDPCDRGAKGQFGTASFARLLGPSVSVATRSTTTGPTIDLDQLDPSELAAVATASPMRKVEFATGRVCAHAALDALGVERSPIPVGRHREPLWPSGIVGSITHAGTMCSAAVAFRSDLAALGIDLEIDAPLPDDVDGTVLSHSEREHIRELAPEVRWDTLVFSAKESVYKAWFPIERRWLGFDDVEVRFDGAGSFVATFVSDSPTVEGTRVPSFGGRFEVLDGFVLTAVRVPVPD